MSSRKFLALGLATVFAVGACTSTSATPSPASQAPAPTAAPASTAPESAAPSESAAAASPSAEALAPDPAEAVIQGVEPNAEIGFWTFYLSPTVRPLDQGHHRPLRGDVPGRQGQLGATTRPPSRTS